MREVGLQLEERVPTHKTRAPRYRPARPGLPPGCPHFTAPSFTVLPRVYYDYYDGGTTAPVGKLICRVPTCCTYRPDEPQVRYTRSDVTCWGGRVPRSLGIIRSPSWGSHMNARRRLRAVRYF